MLAAVISLVAISLVLVGMLARALYVLDRLTAHQAAPSLTAVLASLEDAARLTATVATDLTERVAVSDAQFGRLVVLLDKLGDSVDKGRIDAAGVAADLAASHAEADQADRAGAKPGTVADAGARTPKPRRKR